MAAMEAAGESGELPTMVMASMIKGLAVMYIAILIAGTWLKAYLKTRIRNHVFNNIRLDNALQLASTITTGRLFRFYLVNMLLLVCTLGLAWPWIKVRSAQLMASTTQAHLSGDLDAYVSLQQNRQSALGDEIGEAFDLDANLDLAF